MMDEPLTAPEPAGHPERARRLEPLFNGGAPSSQLPYVVNCHCNLVICDVLCPDAYRRGSTSAGDEVALDKIEEIVI
jgi:hypothetical protein